MGVVHSGVEDLDFESKQLLDVLLGQVNKDDLFKVLVKKPLREKNMKKLVRMMVVPTDSEDDGEIPLIHKKT